MTTSPVPTKEVEEVSFYTALEALANGSRITKLEWGDPETFGVLNEGKVMLRKADGKYYEWIMNDGDLGGTDWVVL